MEKLEKLFNYFDTNSDSDFVGEKSEDLVLRAEEKLGLKFPPSYKQFLLRYGNGGIAPYEIYGITNDNFPECVPDVVGRTIMERRNNLPNHYILIAEEDDWFYVIDTSKENANGENPVMEICVGDFSESNLYAEDFIDFVNEFFIIEE